MALTGIDRLFASAIVNLLAPTRLIFVGFEAKDAELFHASMLTVICWKWKPASGYRSTFAPQTVNVLRNMVARHYQHTHEFVCITDDAAGIDPDIRIVPLWKDFADLPSPHGRNQPSCYRRLKMFSAEMRDVLGERFVSIDLDCVITGDLTPLWQRSDPIVLWGDTHPTTPYNGSMVLMTAGARRQIWDEFDPGASPIKAKQAGCFGSDQGWISYRLGRGEARWTTADGVYSFRNHIMPARGELPKDARIVFCHGRCDPWDQAQMRLAWVRENWR